MLLYDFENSPGYWMVITTRAIRRGMEAELANEGITLRQWEVLAWLTIENGMAQSELADRLGIEAPTLAGILDRMERDGWVERQACLHDRRKKRLRATAKAHAVWQRMAECAYRMRAKCTEGISPEQLQQLKSVCERIRANVDVVVPQVAETRTTDVGDCVPVPDAEAEVAPVVAPLTTTNL